MDSLVRIFGFLAVAGLLALLFFLGFIFFVIAAGGLIAFTLFMNAKRLFSSVKERSGTNQPEEPKVFEAEYTIIKDDQKLDQK